MAEAPIAFRAAPVVVPPAAPAAVDAQKALEASLDKQKNLKQVFASLPLPPRRPRDLAQVIALAANEGNHPLPPRRPGDLVQVAAVAADAKADVKPNGDGKSQAGDDALAAINRKVGTSPAPAVAAYAPVNHPLPPARSDGKRMANAPAPVAISASSQQKTAPTIAMTRTKVQGGSLAALMTAASKGDVVSAFRQGSETGPAVGKFSGTAVSTPR